MARSLLTKGLPSRNDYLTVFALNCLCFGNAWRLPYWWFKYNIDFQGLLYTYTACTVLLGLPLLIIEIGAVQLHNGTLASFTRFDEEETAGQRHGRTFARVLKVTLSLCRAAYFNVVAAYGLASLLSSLVAAFERGDGRPRRTVLAVREFFIHRLLHQASSLHTGDPFESSLPLIVCVLCTSLASWLTFSFIGASADWSRSSSLLPLTEPSVKAELPTAAETSILAGLPASVELPAIANSNGPSGAAEDPAPRNISRSASTPPLEDFTRGGQSFFQADKRREGGSADSAADLPQTSHYEGRTRGQNGKRPGLVEGLFNARKRSPEEVLLLKQSGAAEAAEAGHRPSPSSCESSSCSDSEEVGKSSKFEKSTAADAVGTSGVIGVGAKFRSTPVSPRPPHIFGCPLDSTGSCSAGAEVWAAEPPPTTSPSSGRRLVRGCLPTVRRGGRRSCDYRSVPTSSQVQLADAARRNHGTDSAGFPRAAFHFSRVLRWLVAVFYADLVLLLIRGLCLGMAGSALRRLLSPPASAVAALNPRAWAASAAQVLFSLGVGLGPVMQLATPRNGAGGVVRGAAAYLALNYAVGFLTLFTCALFAESLSVDGASELLVGSAQKGVEFLGLLFPVQVAGPTVLAVIFSAVFVVQGLLSTALCIDADFAVLSGGKLAESLRRGVGRLGGESRAASRIRLFILVGAGSLVLATPAGAHWMQLMDAAVGAGLVALVTVQFYSRFDGDSLKMFVADICAFSGPRLSWGLRFLMQRALPFSLCVALLCQVLEFFVLAPLDFWPAQPASKQPIVCSHLGCFGGGICDPLELVCVCYPGFGGKDCSVTLDDPLTYGCPNNCSGQGVCDSSTGTCACLAGFSGLACNGSTIERGYTFWAVGGLSAVASVSWLLLWCYDRRAERAYLRSLPVREVWGAAPESVCPPAEHKEAPDQRALGGADADAAAAPRPAPRSQSSTRASDSPTNMSTTSAEVARVAAISISLQRDGFAATRAG